jgi:hypothetical protein
MENMGAASVHFTDRELRCHHCGVNGCRQELVDALEEFRSIASADRDRDTPVIVDDAYRCPLYNASVPHAVHGAGHTSQHELGTAADIRVEGATAAELERWAMGVPAFVLGGIGRNDHANFLHVDVRGVFRSMTARWCYDVRGDQMPWYGPMSDPMSGAKGPGGSADV